MAAKKQGTKSAVDKDQLAQQVVQDLTPLGHVTAKKMFGGIGFFLEGVMFAKIAGDGTLYFRVDDTNRAAYEALASAQFQHGEKQKGMPYYQVPEQIVTDKAKFEQWARTAHAVAVANKK